MKDRNYIIKGNVAGYVAMALLIVMFALSVLSISIGLSFKGDMFFMLLLAGIFESCREIYLDFRKKEIEEKANTSKCEE